MRPHRLVIEAMGPFAGEVVVPFDEVGREGLFLIHGPTGAGKTTLLDGLCYALYGEVPGARTDRGLRSDHAAPDATPRVVLEFSAQGGRYRITREAHHEAPKRRGTGTTVRTPTAVLERLDRPMPALTKLAEVRDEVVRLVGLSAPQFQQVILLPQGRFEQVLRGRPEHREELLAALFPTGGYQAMAAWLQDEAKTRRGEADEARRRLGSLAEQAARQARTALGAPEDGSGPGADGHLFDPDLHATDTPDQALLDRLLGRLATAETAAEDLLTGARATVATTRRRREEATEAAAAWDRRQAARREQEALVARQPGIERTRARLARAETAEALRPSIEALASAAATLRGADAEGRAAADAVGAAAADAPWLGDAGPAVGEVVAGGRAGPIVDGAPVVAARAALAAAAAELDALAATGDEARAAEAAAVEAGRDVERHRAAADAARGALAAAEADERAEREALAVADEAGARLPGLQAASAAAIARAEAVVALDRLRPEVLAAREAAVAAGDAANHAWATQLDLRRRWLDDLAGLLARDLEQGAPCAVCGSADHPAPAEPRDGSVERAEVDAAEAAAEAATAAADRARLAADERQRRADALEVAAGPGPHDVAAARTAARVAATDLRTATDVAAGAPAHREALAAAGGRVVAARTALAAAEEARSGAAEREATHRERADAARARLGRSLGPGVDPMAARAPLAALDAALDTLAAAAAVADRATAAVDEARRRLLADLAAGPFATAEEATSALLDPADRDRALHDLAAHQEARARVDARLAEAAEAGISEDRPDDAAARAAADAADAVEERAVRRHQSAAAAVAAVVDLVDRHRRLLGSLGPLEEAAAVHEAVAARCAGRAAPKVSLQRWVLATYLEGICEHANARLAAMTAGRYRLVLARDVLHAGQKAGLDLRVHDAHTGTERPVTTLSGGETFQASLALALGVADSVEARTGGVRLDALFVDEGFGTLDADTLELAMDELDGLRAGGRTVGVISHVAGLRERIHQGIEVTPTRRGSTLRVGAVATG